MSRSQIRTCDICKVEHRSDINRHWSDCISEVILDFKNHPGIQTKLELDVCTNCGKKIYESIEDKIKSLKGVKK